MCAGRYEKRTVLITGASGNQADSPERRGFHVVDTPPIDMDEGRQPLYSKHFGYHSAAARTDPRIEGRPLELNLS